MRGSHSRWDGAARRLLPRSRREVAEQLFPSSSAEQSVQRLRRWIRADASLRRDLEAAGYRPRQHTLGPRSLRVLQRYFS